MFVQVGLGGLEPPTSRLSGVRSNQLSYRPLEGSTNILVPTVCETPVGSFKTWLRVLERTLTELNHLIAQVGAP